MDFNPEEHERAITKLTADVLHGELDHERELGEHGYDERTWRALAKAGLLSLTLPADLGGDELAMTAVAAVLTEVGRCAAEVPALATLALGALPIGALGSPAQRAELLPPVSGGEAVLTAALHEPSAPLTTAPRTTARYSGGRWVLDGVKTGVPYAAVASRILVPASTTDGPRVFLVEPAAAGVRAHESPSSSGSGQYTVRLSDVALDEGALLGGTERGDPLRVLHRFALAAACAVGDGAVAAALELTTSHLSTREQFGRPLAAFQSVAQQAADVYVASRTMHLAATSAAWRLDEGRDPDADLDVAAYWLTEQAPQALANCHHLHGGVGVDETYPLHRYYSLIKDLTHMVGGSTSRLHGLASTIGGAECTSN